VASGTPHGAHRERRRRAADLIIANDIDLIHSAFGWPGGTGGVLARAETGRPLVASLLGADLNVLPEIDYGLRRDSFFDRAIRNTLRTADRTIYVSDFLYRL
jgi:hypothetical protein